MTRSMESPWSLAGPGFGALLAGIVVPLFPHATLGVAGIVAPVVLVAAGIFRILSAFLSPGVRDPRRQVLTGTVLVVVALLALPQAAQSLRLFALLLAAYWIISGLAEGVRFAVPGATPGTGLDLSAAVLRVLAGVTLLVYDSVAQVVLVWLLGAQLLLCGAIAVWVGLAARRAGSHP